MALAMAGHPFNLPCPKVFGVKLTGRLPDWVSGKDVILEMLRRHSVSGGVGKIIEYYGPGVATLSATDRATIGIVAVGSDRRYVQGLLDKVENYVDSLGLAQLLDAPKQVDVY